jgi:hypothetical protein
MGSGAVANYPKARHLAGPRSLAKTAINVLLIFLTWHILGYTISPTEGILYPLAVVLIGGALTASGKALLNAWRQKRATRRAALSSSRLLTPKLEIQLIDALKSAYWHGREARIYFSSKGQRAAAHALVEIFKKAGWEAGLFDKAWEETGMPPQMGIQVAGRHSALVKAVAKALGKAGLPGVRRTQTRGDGPLDVVSITLGHQD